MRFAQATNFSRKAPCASRRATFKFGAVTRTTANAEALFTAREFRGNRGKGQCEIVSSRSASGRFGFNHQARDQSVSFAPGEHHGGSKLSSQHFTERPQQRFAEVFVLPGADTVVPMTCGE